jgi:hypothetical protein
VPRRRFDLGRANLREGQVAERAAPVPAFVALLRQQPLGTGGRIDRLGLQPFDPGEAVSLLAPSLGIEEVVGERLRLRLGEAERAEPGQGVFCPQAR